MFTHRRAAALVIVKRCVQGCTPCWRRRNLSIGSCWALLWGRFPNGWRFVVFGLGRGGLGVGIQGHVIPRVLICSRKISG